MDPTPMLPNALQRVKDRRWSPSFRPSSPTIVNCLFVGNVARDRCGGAINNRESASPTVVNCTFFANLAATSGGAIQSQVDSTGTVTNCILWDNTAPTDPEICLVTGSTLTVTYSCVQGGWTGTGNTDADPLFVDPAAGDLHLQPGSPCVDQGTNAGAPADDLDGNPRPAGAGYDMGAYEFQGTSPYVCKIVDLPTDAVTDQAPVRLLAPAIGHR